MLVAIIAHKGTYNAEPTDPKEMTAIQLVSGYNGLRRPHLPVRHPRLPRTLQELRLRLRGRGGRRRVQGDRVRRPPDRGDQGRAQEVRRAGPASWASRPSRASTRASTSSRRPRTSASAWPSEFPKSTVFAGQTVFRRPGIINRILHNETAFAIQQELRWKGHHDGHFAHPHQYLASLGRGSPLLGYATDIVSCPRTPETL